MSTPDQPPPDAPLEPSAPLDPSQPLSASAEPEPREPELREPDPGPVEPDVPLYGTPPPVAPSVPRGPADLVAPPGPAVPAPAAPGGIPAYGTPPPAYGSTPGYGPPPAYGPPAPAAQGGNATWSLVLGLLSVLVCWCGPISLGLGAVAYLVGRSAQRTAGANTGVARAGAVLGLVGAGLSLLWMVVSGRVTGGDA